MHWLNASVTSSRALAYASLLPETLSAMSPSPRPVTAALSLDSGWYTSTFPASRNSKRVSMSALHDAATIHTNRGWSNSLK